MLGIICAKPHTLVEEKGKIKGKEVNPIKPGSYAMRSKVFCDMHVKQPIIPIT